MASRLVLLLALLVTSSLGQNLCKFTDPVSGANFDLNGLARNAAQGDYEGTDGKYNFTMNICAPSVMGDNCTLQGGAICQYENRVFEAVIGSFSAQPVWVISLIDPNTPSQGVKILYTNGDPCSDGTNSTRQVELKLFCNQTAPVVNTFSVVEPVGTVCIYNASFTTPLACPITSNARNLLSNETLVVTNLAAYNWTYYSMDTFYSTNELNIITSQTTYLSVGHLETYIRFGAYPTATAYDQADLSNNQKHKLVVRYGDNNQPMRIGTWYIGVRANGGPITFSVTGQVWTCYGDFNLPCSGHGSCQFSGSTGRNYCACDANYNVAIEPDCSSEVVSNVTAGQIYSATLTDDETKFYRFELTDVNAYQLFVEVARSPNDADVAKPTILIKQGTWPTTADNDGQTGDLFTPTMNWELAVSGAKLTTGTWIVSVTGSRDVDFKYSLTINVYDCPENCNDHGICDPVSHLCNCESEYSGTPACDVLNQPLPEGNTPVTLAPYTFSYFAVDVSSAYSSGQVDLAVSVSVPSTEDYPRVYINFGTLPSTSAFFVISPYPTTANTTVRVPAAALKSYGAGSWYVGVRSYHAVDQSATITLKYEGYCPADCSGHGTCKVNPSTGAALCSCSGGWTGLGCDVKSSSDDSVDDGTVAAVVIILFLAGLAFGVFIKRKKPDLCANICASRDGGVPSSGYSTMHEETDA